MEIPNSFARTLAKLEGRVKKLNMALHNTRHLYELGDQEMTYAVAMRLADTAEQVTLLARALPACTGNPIAAQELQDVMAINVPVEMGFTKEGWFSVRLPLLLPKRSMQAQIISVQSCIRQCRNFSRAGRRSDIRTVH